MTDYPLIVFPNYFALDVRVEENMPNNDIITRSSRRYPVPLRTYPHKKIEVSYGPKSQTDLNVIRDLFHIMDGTRHTFRVLCPQDSNSLDETTGTITMLDQNIGTGDASEDTFQLRKARTVGATTVYSDIKHIVPGSEKVALDGVLTTAYTLDDDTGIMVFTSPPGSSVVITAGYRYYHKVRFADPNLLQQFITNQRSSFDSFFLEVEDN